MKTFYQMILLLPLVILRRNHQKRGYLPPSQPPAQNVKRQNCTTFKNNMVASMPSMIFYPQNHGYYESNAVDFEIFLTIWKLIHLPNKRAYYFRINCYLKKNWEWVEEVNRQKKTQNVNMTRDVLKDAPGHYLEFDRNTVTHLSPRYNSQASACWSGVSWTIHYV